MKLPTLVAAAVVLIVGMLATGLYLDHNSYQHRCAKRPWLDMSRGC